ncbi:hypothetical protein GGI07_002383 [Coemansia sp. Benny D115]|nr:hypothetical protein GGI07_002383 [Coemansia sp. Benny D115]
MPSAFGIPSDTSNIASTDPHAFGDRSRYAQQPHHHYQQEQPSYSIEDEDHVHGQYYQQQQQQQQLPPPPQLQPQPSLQAQPLYHQAYSNYSLEHESQALSALSLHASYSHASMAAGGRQYIGNGGSGVNPYRRSSLATHENSSESTYSHEYQPTAIERTAYQYALRHAMLLDAETEQLAARTRSIGSKVDHRSSIHSYSSSENETVGMSVKTVSRATGLPNLTNRTPTLVLNQRGKTPVLVDQSNDDSSIAHESPGKRLWANAKEKGWRTSLFELSDSAARRLKSDISNMSKLKDKAKNKLNSSGSTSPPPLQPPALRTTLPVRDGGLPPSIIKALAQQLESSSEASTIHPFTAACFMGMFTVLDGNENGCIPGENWTLDDLFSEFTDALQRICADFGIRDNDSAAQMVSNQKGLFYKVLQGVLQSKAQSSREAGRALLKLDDYSPASPDGGFRPRSQSELPLPAAHRQQFGQDVAAEEAERASRLASTWLRQIFNVPTAAHRQMIRELRREVDQDTFVQDLRTSLVLVKGDKSFAGRPDEFVNEHMYTIWKEREILSLEQLINSYSIMPRFMSGEDIPAGRIKLEESAILSMDYEKIASAFEYIPSNSAECYRVLIEKAIEHDIVDKYSPSDDSKYLKQLSKPATDMLHRLTIAWRIRVSYREVCYLDIIDSHCASKRLPETYLIEAFGKVERNVHNIKPIEWPIAQFNYLVSIEERIEYRVLNVVKDVIEELDQHSAEKTAYIKRLLCALLVCDAKSPMDLKKPAPLVNGRRNEVLDILEPHISFRCDCLKKQCFGDEDLEQESSFGGYATLADHVLGDYEKCREMFSEPIFKRGDRRFDIAGIVAEIETKYFWDLLKRHIDRFGYVNKDANIEAAFELCALLVKIEDLHSQYSDVPLGGISSKRLFKETVDLLLERIDMQRILVVENALKQDRTFPEFSNGKHSTSVYDVLTCFSSHAEMAKHLDWPDTETKAYFLARFMELVCVTFENYAIKMLDMFKISLNSSSADSSDQRPTSRVLSSMLKSRKYKEQALSVGASTQEAISKLDQASSREISADACINLNNLTFALERLQDIQEILGIDETMERLGGENRPSIKDATSKVALLSFKVVRAEGLQIYKQQYDTKISTDQKPYVKLARTWLDKDNVQKRSTFASTRPATTGFLNPRWNESFDLQINTRDMMSTQIEARICTRDSPSAGSQSKTRARICFTLPSSLEINADGSEDIVLELEPAGHLVLQINMDRELDDAEFYSGRMFRYLRRVVAEMQQLIVEQVSTEIREYLRQILVTQHTRHRAGKIIGAGFASIERSVQFIKRSGRQSTSKIHVTPESCREALIPLFDYLESNLHVLFVSLYETTADEVITRVWNEALVAIEDILLPPLRGSSKGIAKSLGANPLKNIYECVDFLKWYFGGGDDMDGLPLEVLEGSKYMELIKVREMYFMTIQELIDAYMDEMRRSAVPITVDEISPSKNISSSASAPQLKGGPYNPSRPYFEAPSIATSLGNNSHENYNGTGPSRLRLDHPLPPIPSSSSIHPPPPALPPRLPGQNTSGIELDHRIHLSDDSFDTESQDIRTAIVPMFSNRAPLGRSRSVWAHKNAATIRAYERKNRMVTDTGDIILRLLRLRYGPDAQKFVEDQLDSRDKQVQYGMRRISNARVTK